MIDDDENLDGEDLEDALDDLEFDKWSEGAVLWSTDWTAETIQSQLNRKNIDLDPIFQRRSAWTDTRQSLFIESLILGLPIPQLILAEAPQKKGSFIVIDGKQRLLSIRRFGSTGSGDEFLPLKLRGLSKLSGLNDSTLEQLRTQPKFSEHVSAFENASIRTVVIRNWKNEDYLYEVFLRINNGSVRLSPQELRQALHPGLFSRFIDDASASSEELHLALNLTDPDFRMRDAELLLRYLAYRNFMGRYRGNLKQFLDEATEELNASWVRDESKIRDQQTQMDAALAFTRSIFGDEYYLRKWNGKKFEPQRNRAVFDIMLHTFCHKEVRDSLKGKEKELVNRFKSLCEEDRDFRAALETTTKSIVSNRVRFNTWIAAVSELSDLNLDHIKFPQTDADA